MTHVKSLNDSLLDWKTRQLTVFKESGAGG